MACHALIVAVGAYDYPGLNLETPIANASLTAARICALNEVAPENVHVILSGAQQADVAALSALGVNVADNNATQDRVENYLIDKIAPLKPTELLVYWSGHGIVHQGQRYFLCQDYTEDKNDRVFSVKLFQNRLTTARFGGVETCWFLADVCGCDVGLPVGAPGTVVDQELAGPDSLYAFATPELIAARSADGHGVFTALLADVFKSLQNLPTPKRLADLIEAAAPLGQPFQLDVCGKMGEQAFSYPLHIVGSPRESGLPGYLEELYSGLCKAELRLGVAEAAYRETYKAIGNSKLALRPSDLKAMLTELAQTGTSSDEPSLWLGVFVDVLKQTLVSKDHKSYEALNDWQQTNITGHLAERVSRKSQLIKRKTPKLLVVEVETRSADHLVRVCTVLREASFHACIQPPTLFADGHQVTSWDEVFELLVKEIEHLLNSDVPFFSIHVVASHGLENINLHTRDWYDTASNESEPLGKKFGVLLHYLPRHLRKPTRLWYEKRINWVEYCDPLLREGGGSDVEWKSVTSADQAYLADELPLCFVNLAPDTFDFAAVTKALLDQGVPCIYWQDPALGDDEPPILSEDPDRCYLDKMSVYIKRLRAAHAARGPLVWDVVPTHLTLLDGEGEEEIS